MNTGFDLTQFTIDMRHHRVCGYSSLEVFGTILMAILLTNGSRKLKITSFFKNIIFILLSSICAHYYFGANTQLMWNIGLSECPPNHDSFSGIFGCQ